MTPVADGGGPPYSRVETPNATKSEFHDHVQLIEFIDDVRGQVNPHRRSGDLFPGIWNMNKVSPAIIGITSDSG